MRESTAHSDKKNYSVKGVGLVLLLNFENNNSMQVIILAIRSIVAAISMLCR